MRQLKQMMRTRKEQMLGCGSCECLTLKCRRENDEFCGCNGGGGGSSKITELIGFPTDVSISEGTVSTYSFRFAPVKHYDDINSQITFVDPYNLVEAYIYSRNDNGDARVTFSVPMGRTGSTSLQVYLNGEHYMDTLVQVTPYVYVDSIYNLPNTIDVYTGGGSGSNSEVLQFKFSPTNANNPLGEISFENYDGESIGFLGSTRANFDGDAWYSFGPQAGDDQVGQTYNYKAMIRGEYTGQNIGLRLIKGIIPTENYSMDSLSVERGTFNSQDRIEITDNVTDPEELNSVRLEYDPNIVNVSCNAQQDGGRTFLHINVEGVAVGDTYVTITFVNGVSFTLYVEVVPNMEDNIMNWFVQTPVYTNLTSEQQEQATEDARQIIESAGDDIIPFYTAMQEGRTFANYAEQMGLTPDTSGSCDSSVYTDDEAFIIYIGTAGAVSCEYLALVARRGITPHQELVNKQAISDYLDWVTQGTTYTYQFKDWDGEILKFGSVVQGGTPEAPQSIPPREGYTFTGWSPAIGPISVDTTYIAQYTPTIIPVASVSNIPTGKFYVGRGYSTSYTFNYAPANANDFSNLVVDDIDVSYDYSYTSSTVSYDNGVATVTTTGNNVGSDLTEWYVNVKLNNALIGKVAVMVGDTEFVPFEEVCCPNPNKVEIDVGETAILNFTYKPMWANQARIFVEDGVITSYGVVTSSRFVSFENGTGIGTIEVTGTQSGSSSVYLSTNDQYHDFVEVPTYVGVNKVESINVSSDEITVGVGETKSIAFTYTPADAENFSEVEIVADESYDDCATVELSPFIHEDAGHGDILITGKTIGEGNYDININGVRSAKIHVETAAPVYTITFDASSTMNCSGDSHSVELNSGDTYRFHLSEEGGLPTIVICSSSGSYDDDSCFKPNMDSYDTFSHWEDGNGTEITDGQIITGSMTVYAIFPDCY